MSQTTRNHKKSQKPGKNGGGGDREKWGEDKVSKNELGAGTSVQPTDARRESGRGGATLLLNLLFRSQGLTHVRGQDWGLDRCTQLGCKPWAEQTAWSQKAGGHRSQRLALCACSFKYHCFQRWSQPTTLGLSCVSFLSLDLDESQTFLFHLHELTLWLSTHPHRTTSQGHTPGWLSGKHVPKICWSSIYLFTVPKGIVLPGR